MKYVMIKANTPLYSIRMMCRLLSVSPSGYYDWLERPPSLQSQKNSQLAKKINHIFEEEKARPGAIRIAKRLKAESYSVGRHCVAKIMGSQGLKLQRNLGQRPIVIINYLLLRIYCSNILKHPNPMKSM